MVVGVLRISVSIPDSGSLKDKRSVIQPLKARIQNQFHVSVAEVGHLDNMRFGELGIACVSTETRHADEVMAKIAAFADWNSGSGAVEAIQTEVIHLG